MGKSELRESLGLLLVFLGLVFVGLEMRQNTQMMQAQVRNAISERVIEVNGWLATSEALAEATATTADEGLAGLSRQQEMQMVGWTGGAFRAWENEHYQNKVGLFTDAEFSARKEMWRRQLLVSPLREAYWDQWERFSDSFAPDFRAEIDAIMEEARQPQ